MQCSGYGRTFRWANAIAIRGRYKGMLNPRMMATPVVKTAVTTGSTLKPPQSEVADISEWLKPARLVARIFPESPTATEIHKLVRYYDGTIAGMMVWMDSNANPYRRLALPRAKTEPVLLLAILAVASEHMAATQGKPSTFALKARDKVVSSITTVLQEITKPRRADEGTLAGTVDLKTAEWVLAAMLVLTNYECVGSTSSTWCLHRLGARTLIKAVNLPDDRHPPELYVFLMSQFSIYDVLASTTTSVFMNSKEVILPCQGEEQDMLAGYMRVIHDVTVFSKHDKSFTGSFVAPDVLRMRLELARGSALIKAGRICDKDQDENVRGDLIFLVSVYHTAVLLYAYRQAYKYLSSDTVVQAASQELFQYLSHIILSVPQALNLLWPAFIAGTECRGDQGREKEVSNWFDVIVKASGFKKYQLARSFLEEYWRGEYENWLTLAEDWERSGRPLLVV